MAAGPLVAIILLPTVLIINWKRPSSVAFRARLKEKLGLFPKEKVDDPKEQRPIMAKFKPHLKRWMPWLLRKKIIDPETPSPHGRALAN